MATSRIDFIKVELASGTVEAFAAADSSVVAR